MPRLTPYLVAALSLHLLGPHTVRAQAPAIEQVQKSLAAQDEYLAHEAHGPAWNQYLLSAQLKEQLAKREAADAIAVKQVLAKYEAREPGLRTAHFATTRRALTAWANELSQPAPADLPAIAAGAQSRFRTIDKSAVMTRQVAVEAAVRRLDRYLKNSGANGPGWRSHLKWNVMQAELKKGLEAKPAVLREIGDQYFTGDAGLELAPFAGMGAALNSFADLLATYQDADANKSYQETVAALSADLTAAAEKPAEIDRRKMGAALGKLTAADQATDLVAAIRRQYAQPNLLVRVSKYIVTAGIGDDVDERTPISDNILGTSVSGQGYTRGAISARMIPNDEQARLEIRLSGNTRATTVGRNGPATIFASSNTSLLGRKFISISDDGFFSDPAHAQCHTSSHIDGINVNGCRLIQKIATKRVYGSKSTAENISARHAETRLENRMNTRTGGLLAEVNRNYHAKFRNPLARQGAFPDVLSFSTSADWLSVDGLAARNNELAATTPPPAPGANVELSLRVHESLLDNMAEALLAGQTSGDEDFKRVLRNVRGGKLNEAEFQVLLRNLRDGEEPYEDFNSLLADRFERTLTPAQFASLVAAIQAKQVTAVQAKDYLTPFAEMPYSAEQITAMLADLPEESQGAMTFAATQPVSVRFRDGTAAITLRAASYVSRNGVEKKVPMNVTAVYKLELAGEQLMATRQGELEIAPPGFKAGDRLDLEQTGARGTLRRRFEEIFRPEFTSTGLTLRGRWKKLGELPWAQLVSQDGWLAAGFKAGAGEVVSAE